MHTPGPLSPGSQWDSPTKYPDLPESPTLCPGAESPEYETRKAGVRAACHLPDPVSRDIESLWVLYSDSR